MAGYGTVALFLLIGIGMANYLAGYPVGFTAIYTAFGNQDINSIVNTILSALSNSLVLATATIALFSSYALGNTVRYSVGVAVLIAVTNTLFVPFTVFKEASLPQSIQMFVVVFFNLLLFLSVIGFVFEKEP